MYDGRLARRAMDGSEREREGRERVAERARPRARDVSVGDMSTRSDEARRWPLSGGDETEAGRTATVG